MRADPSAAVLDRGFQQLYELNFQGARTDFSSYQRLHPEDPLGKTAEAASYLYEQFSEKGVLSSEFFLDDDKFLGGVDGDPAKNRNSAFLNADDQARKAAQQRLKSAPNDPRGLLALTMADGMQSDYEAIIERKQIAALGTMRKAEDEAKTLLAVDPDADDAYVALGASNYIIGCMPAYKRAFLWFGGIHGDRARGMQELQSAAKNGRYLKPFAKILLALAAEREHQNELARGLLDQLTRQFPKNPLFARELSLLKNRLDDKKAPGN